MVRVNEVRHPVAHTIGIGDLVDGSLDVVADGRRSVEQNDAVWRGQEPALVDAVGHPVEVALNATDVVSLFVHRRPERRLGNRRVRQQGVGPYGLRVDGHGSLLFSLNWVSI